MLLWGRVRAVALAMLIAVAIRGGDELRLGYFPNITHAQALYAKNTGDFEKITGAKIHWTAFNAGPSAVESLFVNAIDATYIGPSPTVNGYMKSRGEKFVIVAGAASGGAGLILRSDSGIKTAKDFNGKTIATPQLGNTQDIAARTWFAEQGYRFKERGGTLALVPLSNPDQLTMFQKKQIDGAWTVEPWLSRLELEAGGRVFLEEKTLWPEGKFVTTHLVVTRDLLQRNPALVRKLIAAHIEVTQKINADKQGAIKIINAQLKTDTGKSLKDATIEKAFARVEFTWDPIQESLRKNAEEARQLKFLRKEPNLTGIYALNPLNEVLAEKHLDPISK